MHIPYSDNKNQALFGETNETVPLVYFNIINLKKGESYEYQLSKHESSVVPATGIVEITVEDNKLGQIGKRTTDVWDGEPECVYIPCNKKSLIKCVSKKCELFIAGAKYDKILEPFVVRSDDIDLIQYGSDDTKTHRKRACVGDCRFFNGVFTETTIWQTTSPRAPFGPHQHTVAE